MMKKHLIFALALSCATFSLTACHDNDDDGDDSSDYVMDYSNPKVNTNVFFDKIAGTTNVSTFLFSDANGYSDLYHYNLDGELVKALVDEGLVLSSQIMDSIGNNFYGGFCPTWYSATDEDSYLTPICGQYHSGSSALLCNPGTLCRALFSKHMQADLSAATSALVLKSIKYLWVTTPDTYTALVDDEYKSALGVTSLPANHRIEFVVYGYVDSFRFSDFKTFLSALQSASKQVGEGGKMSESITLAESDANGKVTLLKEWKKLDLTQNDIDDCYVYEAYIRVVDTTTGKTSKVYQIDATNNANLNFALVDDITYEGRSLF